MFESLAKRTEIPKYRHVANQKHEKLHQRFYNKNNSENHISQVSTNTKAFHILLEECKEKEILEPERLRKKAKVE
ncbi:hypothetical protein O9G_003987 [Rozella allomycis CSF55]|uniref:Uncharacterized protein n=1 Tax=Rozella allomycis (strain CSF55) TaxID=988480 RepID=A0A075AZ78_ROZAC|nr:hypothetical protein O9G_003987 [Rozella allomycis CSF55]|eukprot:EPZ33879.1 hypothetical protein O9G_003987 [Rozella allomycis CSF55]